MENYLHLYLGCEAQVKRKYDREFSIGRICEVTRASNHSDWVKIWFDDIITVTSNTRERSTSNIHHFFMREDSIKLILRPLSDITEEEAEHFTWLCMDSKHHLDEDSRISKRELWFEIIQNDNGLMLDSDIDLYIDVSVRCWEGGIAFYKDGTICTVDGENKEPLEEMPSKIHWLLSKHFDLFGLIDAGLAIDKTKIHANK